MTDLELAAELLGVDAKFLQPFDVTDPFNEEARLEGLSTQFPRDRMGHVYAAIASLGG